MDNYRSNYAPIPIPVFDKPEETRKLIEIAVNCGVEKSEELFDKVIKLVYGDRQETIESINNIFDKALSGIKDLAETCTKNKSEIRESEKIDDEINVDEEAE